MSKRNVDGNNLHCTRMNIFLITLKLKEIWSHWQFPFWLWSKRYSIWFVIKGKTVTTIIFLSICKESEKYLSEYLLISIMGSYCRTTLFWLDCLYYRTKLLQFNSIIFSIELVNKMHFVKSISGSWCCKPNYYYTFQTDLKSNEITFCAESIGKL